MLRVIIVIGSWTILSILIKQYLGTPCDTKLAFFILVIGVALIDPVVVFLSETHLEISATVSRGLSGYFKAVCCRKIIV